MNTAPVGADQSAASPQLSWARETARRAREVGRESLSDSDLESLLHSSAALLDRAPPDENVAEAIGAVDVAVRRRLGTWRVATWEIDDLYGKVRGVREQVEATLITSSSRVSRLRSEPIKDEACRTLAKLLTRLRTEHPSEVRLSADVYDSLENADDSGCLWFSPTEQQLTAAALLLRGVIVEMDAGEGKTLASAIAVAVFAASGRSVHVLTANDYLANRDCEALAPVLESLGLTVGLVVDGMERQERRYQYAAQVVFTTAREVGFDYLRDCVAESFDRRVNPIFDVAIVDEADHLLVDQARTPLIISGDRVPEPMLGTDLEAVASELVERQAAYIDELYARLPLDDNGDIQDLATILLAGGLTSRLVSELDRSGISTRGVYGAISRLNDEDEGRPLERDLLFAIDADRSMLRLTERGWEEVYGRVDDAVSAYGIVQATRARVLHDSGADYVLHQDGVTLVDRLDGRPMMSHRYMHGLHEALESKEGLNRQGRTDARARTTIGALMSNYKTVAGLTGTALEAANVFAREYSVDTVRVPPEIDSKRVGLDTEVFFDRNEHIAWVVEQVSHWHSLGRPVLVTTGSVTESATFSSALTERSVPHELLNAEQAEAESEIVSGGGEFGAVTVSTGMAGRGTDFVVEREADLAVVGRTAELARLIVERGDCAAFECASQEEAEVLLEVLNEVESVETDVRHSDCTTEVLVCRRRGPCSTGEERLSFGLGMMVIITSLPESPRVERQVRGRTGRQGGFGASKLAIYINDPALAFSRRQGDIAKLSATQRGTVEGPEVARVLTDVQTDAESQRERVTRAMSEYETVIEGESRSHYSSREDLMGSHQSSTLVKDMVSNWVSRRTKELDDQRTDYETRFAIVSDGLWHRYGIDIGTSAHVAPSEIRQDLELEVHRRLSLHRDRLGSKRFVLAVADCRLRSADNLWPARLAGMQDMALTLALGASPRHAAVTELAEQIADTGTEFWADVDDVALREMLNSGHVAVHDRMGDNRIEQLPGELEALLQ